MPAGRCSCFRAGPPTWRRATSFRCVGTHSENATGALPIRIVLADDHRMVRSGLRLLLEAAAGLEVVAEAGTVDEAVRYVRGHHPDVLVLDLNMPAGSSLEAIP